MRKSNSKLGITLMLIGMFTFSAVDTVAKFLTDTFHPVQIIWFRQLGLLGGVAILLLLKGPGILRTKRLPMQVGRGVLAICSALLFVFAVKYAPLADVVAATFVAPFFLTILGALVLGERVGLHRWSAVLVGFIGALIIIRPGLGTIHPAVMLAVLAAFVYAVRQVIGRLLSDTDPTITTIAYTAIVGSCIISVPLPLVWQTPVSGFQIALLVVMAVLAAVGEVLVIKALEVAEAVVVAPMHYTLIIWGTLYGYFVFHQLPDRWTWLGTAIIIVAGLYTLQRERRLKH
ncbi:MAG: DMT family transporter [Pseudomonadota bacterium]